MESAAWKIGGFWGGVRRPDERIERSRIFSSEFNNFGRLDHVSRSVSTALAALLGSVGLYPSDSKLDVPVLISSCGSFSRADIDYFEDFVSFGETAGRANLFVYTLPTSSLGVASFHFGRIGGLEYVMASDRSGLVALCEAVADKYHVADVMEWAPAERFIIVLAEETESGADALAMLVSPPASMADDTLTLDEIRGISYESIAELRDAVTGKMNILKTSVWMRVDE